MAVLTVNQTIDNIDSFIQNIKDLSKSYYIFVGRPNPWTDDNDPPTANASVEQTELSLYRDMIYGKLITNNDVSYMLRKIEWTSNTVYAQYSQNDADLIDKDFYVMNDVGQVYKCIYNNANAQSTIKPSLTTTTGTFKTSDGYVWKYMYTVETAANTKFTTSSYIPVTVNNDVESFAVPGTIDYITISNTGTNYDIYEEDFLLSVANNGYVVFLPNNSSQVDNYYTGTSIYLKSGGGAGQIRSVAEYRGLDRALRVDRPFDVYVNLNLDNPQGTIEVGDTASQNATSMAHYYDKGYFNLNDTLFQPGTGATGIIKFANSSNFTISKNNASAAFSANIPVYNTTQSFVTKSGNVTIIAGNNFVIANTGTAFTTDYAVGDYISVGPNTSINTTNPLRRITSVNSTIIILDANTTDSTSATYIGNTITSTVHHSLPSATTPTSVGAVNRYGTISYVNLDGINISISNTTPAGASFSAGELVKMYDTIGGTYQDAEAIVAFSNASALELTSVEGPGTFQAGYYVTGQSSNTSAYISSVMDFPNITVSDPYGTFEVGLPLYINNTLGTVVGNATVLSTTVTPNMLTEYIISPKVTISGDGNGALAYAYVDISTNNPDREISDIIMINHGTGYTTANVAITSNNQYGSGAAATAAISPVLGHGANTYMELGAKYVGISVTFANGDNESFKYPVSGKYRRVGILEDPTFEDATLTLNSYDRVKLYLGNSTGTFIPGEVVLQNTTSVAGIVVYANTVNNTSGFIELKNVIGNSTFSNTALGLPFITNTVNNSNTSIIGLRSGARANVMTTQVGGMTNSSVSYFRLLSNVEAVSEVTSGATATITQIVSNNSIRVGNIKGHFNANDILSDATTNAYANVVTIRIANDSVDATTDFGHKFTQTCRIPLTSNNGTFQQFEVVTQQTSNGTGTVMTWNNDRDILLSSNAIDVNTGDYLHSTTGGTAIALSSNGIYIKCTAANGTIGVGDVLYNGSNTAIGNVTSVYSALVLYNVYNIFETSTSYQIVGANSGANGLTTLEGAITYPELVRDSGQTTYIENIMPFERSNTSSEKVNIIIKF